MGVHLLGNLVRSLLFGVHIGAPHVWSLGSTGFEGPGGATGPLEPVFRKTVPLKQKGCSGLPKIKGAPECSADFVSRLIFMTAILVITTY